MTGKELLPLIRSAGRGDRMSENLSKWVKKHSDVPLFVAYSPISCLDGKDLGPFNLTKTLAHQLYVGYGDLDDGWLHGARLSEILCEGTRAKEWAQPPSRKFQVLPDWWQGYIDGGKCFIDPEHRIYFERWQLAEDGNTRDCIWCGAHRQQKRVEMVPREYWDSVTDLVMRGEGR